MEGVNPPQSSPWRLLGSTVLQGNVDLGGATVRSVANHVGRPPHSSLRSRCFAWIEAPARKGFRNGFEPFLPVGSRGGIPAR